MEIENIIYESKLGKQCWTSRIVYVEVISKQYIQMIIEGRGSRIEILVGSTSQYNWISFPQQEKCCELATLTDDFWNMEHLKRIINKVDTQTVIGALNILHRELMDKS